MPGTLRAVVVAMAVCGFVVQSSADGADNGTSLPEITLRDHHGAERSLHDAEAKGVAIVFLGTECPLARLYAARLQELHERYAAHGIRIYGVNSNVQDSLTEVAAFARQHQVEFPILMDNRCRLADAVKAERTPEAFLFNALGALQYRGRIDDQFAVGVQRPAPTRNELADAIDSLLSGRAVEVARTEPVGCLIGRPLPQEPSGEITYAAHVAEILDRRCVECHRGGEIAPFPLTDYEETIGWGPMIAEVVGEGRMPPWNANPAHGEFRNDARLTADEKSTLLAWVANGCPEGNSAQRPAKPEFAAGWRIGEPDAVIAMRDEPFDVPATGVVDYQYFEVQGFEEDRYVSEVEARPGNREVVHHIIVYMRPPEAKEKQPGHMLVGYAPGTPPPQFDPGEAILVPAGWKLLFELHYTPNGRPQQDRSYVGLKFADPSTIRRPIDGGEVHNAKFKIPPGAGHHEVTAERTLKHDIDLISLTPHMHLRGKSFRYEAILPGKEPEVLLDVPAYDFNWQLRYELAQRRRLPAGTRIVCTAHFDNSAGNPNNPDPTKEVGWGEQSWDEMMIGFYTCVRPDAETAAE